MTTGFIKDTSIGRTELLTQLIAVVDSFHTQPGHCKEHHLERMADQYGWPLPVLERMLTLRQEIIKENP